MDTTLILIISATIISIIWVWWLGRNKINTHRARKIAEQSDWTPVSFYTIDDVLDHPDLQKIRDAKTAQLTRKNS
jgi:hypothetical protein